MKRLIVFCICALLFLPMQAQNLNVQDFSGTVAVADSVYNLKYKATAKLRLKKVTQVKGKLNFYFDGGLSNYPVHQSSETLLRKLLKENLPAKYASLSIGNLYSDGLDISHLKVVCPDNSGRSTKSAYTTKAPAAQAGTPLVQRELSAPKGLWGRHIALWQSHGYYFSIPENKWTWQRPCMFQTIEDLYTQSYVVPFLAPMLENAGATVLLPRERDWHTAEIIIDNDPSENSSSRIHGTVKVNSGKWKSIDGGFADYKAVYDDASLPFGHGTALRLDGCPDKAKSQSVSWWADVPQRGEYAVYVSYIASGSNNASAQYTVHALGADHKVCVNQRIGSGTWVFLGTFEFKAGQQKLVTLSNYGKGQVVADAVKIGGGMGNIARSCPGDSTSCISGMPRFAEGARYWMQWAGITEQAWSQNDGKDDYRDDFMSRGKWVQYLSGGSRVNPKEKGLGIPVDLSFGFHTDAGTKPDDSIVGTLAIYTLKCDNKTKLPNGGSRNTCRELTDIVQTQIVNDLQHECDSLWQRRMLWNRSYSESRTTGTPAILLELLSHQNFEDMKFGLDPQFRFTVSRACYKGILKYLAVHYGTPYVVQPLPVKHFSARLDSQGKNVILSWKETEDTLEPTAKPTAFLVQKRIDDGGWDKGVRLGGLKADANGYYTTLLPIKGGRIHSFKVSALNEGGKSFPSEILAVGSPADGAAQKVMVVNGFHRISGPTWFDSPLYAGFDSKSDSGVPFGMDWSFVGEQFEFHRDIAFEGIYNTGFGASHSDYANKVVCGNTFDYPYIHGCSILKAGFAFESCSSEAFSDCEARWTGNEASPWAAVDIIYGKQCRVRTASRSGIRSGVLDLPMQNAIAHVCSLGSNIIISGSYIAKDLFSTIYPIEVSVDEKERKDSRAFVRKTLGYTYHRSFASRGGLLNLKSGKLLDKDGWTVEAPMHFPVSPCMQSYCVEAPDALLASGTGKSSVFMVYSDSGLNAALITDFDSYKVAALGFPLEILDSAPVRDALFSDILKEICK